jgi:hypothetical protein
MDELTIEPVTHDNNGLRANIHPWSFENIPPKPLNAPRTNEEQEWWDKMRRRAERRHDTLYWFDE